MDVNGEDILYYYFKNEMLETESETSKLFISKMIRDLSIWLPKNLFCRVPVIIPFVIRDPSCRKSVNKKREEWGTCNNCGYFRDDNSLVKAIPKRFKIIGQNKKYHNATLGNGFVASHIWRFVPNDKNLASRDPLTNTFLPNLVWLPKQLSKLTDREGSFAQKYLQAISYSLYHNEKFTDKHMRSYVKKIWKKIPKPKNTIDQSDLKKLHFFEFGESDIIHRINKLNESYLLLNQRLPKKKLYSSRYLPSFKKLPEKVKSDFLIELGNYVNLLK